MVNLKLSPENSSENCPYQKGDISIFRLTSWSWGQSWLGLGPHEPPFQAGRAVKALLGSSRTLML